MNIKKIVIIISLCAVLVISTCQTSATVSIEPVQPAVSESSAVNTEKVLIVESKAELPVTKPPQVDMASMKIGNINPNRAEIVVTINVENPNVFEISPPIITYDYHLNRNSFIRGIIEGENLLAASSVTPVVFRLFVSYSDLYRSYRQLRTSNLTEIPSFLTMTCDYKNPNFTWEVLNFELAGTLPLIRQ